MEAIKNPKVSILIRTHKRPEVLRRALESVRAQTYPHIETVIVEDGMPCSDTMIHCDFSDMDIVYECLGTRCGRSAAGNRALELATGKYCNFLDDDDLLYPQHVQLLMDKLRETGGRIAYALAEESQTSAKNGREKRRFVRYKVKPSRLMLCAMNYLPIQSVLFARSLYEEKGGFDLSLTHLEDWDLWLRYSAATSLEYVPQVTSLYHTPYKSKDKSGRDKDLAQAADIVLQKARAYHMDFTVEEIYREMCYILWEYRRTGLFFYARKLRNFLLYRDS